MVGNMDDYKLQKHSIIIAGHSTSITLENIFWLELKKIAKNKSLSLGQLITQLDDERAENNLSSAIRVFILKEALNSSV
jgi:predicted DNA-binding ribbon-helix-helix protein